MPKRFKLTDESVNVYGFRVLTSGWLNREAFERNAVMLWNHIESYGRSKDDILPIGRWKNFEVKDGGIEADPEFDMNDEFAKKIADKVENGFLNAVSIGLRIIETSEDPALMLPGQKRATVTKWELREASIVDIPANANALALYDDAGTRISLKEDGSDCPIPFVNLKSINTPTQMELKELAIVAGFLGLKDSASLSDVQTQIAELKAKADRATALEAQIKEISERQAAARRVQAEALLKEASEDGRINDMQRANFVKLFDLDFDTAKATLEGLPKQVQLSDAGKGTQGAADTYLGKTFKQLEKENPAALAQLKEKNFLLFTQLYEADYGKPYAKRS